MSQYIDLLCVGRAKPGSPELAIYQKYVKRCRFSIRLGELTESKAKDPKTIMLEEAEAMREKLHKQAFIIALDERGKELSSLEIASVLDKSFFDQRVPTFVIGGSFGIDPTLGDQANLKVRFGRVVWPHLLIRGMLAEQIYRAQTILDHHPYHRM